MGDPVTAVQLAARVGVATPQFRAWLRRQAAEGQVVVRGHQHGARWLFTADEAEELALQFRRSRAGG